MASLGLSPQWLGAPTLETNNNNKPCMPQMVNSRHRTYSTLGNVRVHLRPKRARGSMRPRDVSTHRSGLLAWFHPVRSSRWPHRRASVPCTTHVQVNSQVLSCPVRYVRSSHYLSFHQVAARLCCQVQSGIQGPRERLTHVRKKKVHLQIVSLT